MILYANLRIRTREKKVESLEKENQTLKGNLSSVNVELSNKTKENKKLTEKMAATERTHEKVWAGNLIVATSQSLNVISIKVVSGLHAEVQSLLTRISEVQAHLQKEGEKLREARKTQRKLEEKNANLTAQLSAAQVRNCVTSFMTNLCISPPGGVAEHQRTVEGC